MIDQQDIEKGAFAASLEERVALLAAGERLAGIGSWRWQIDHDVITCSPGWLDLYGCRVAPRSIAALKELVYPDDREKVDGAMLALLAGESPYALEYRIVRSEAGDLRRLCASAEVARDANGKPVEVIGCVRDIGTARSEQQSAGQTGQEDTGDAAANAESAARNALLANISHQIRTSITAILGIAEMLKADILTPRHVERLNTITDAAQNLLSVINEGLEPARVEVGVLVAMEQGTRIGVRHALRHRQSSIAGSRRGRKAPFATASGIVREYRPCMGLYAGTAENSVGKRYGRCFRLLQLHDTVSRTRFARFWPLFPATCPLCR
jgi:signal transduction histidine kinase